LIPSVEHPDLPNNHMMPFSSANQAERYDPTATFAVNKSTMTRRGSQ